MGSSAVDEQALVFETEGQHLVGILACPDANHTVADLGVVIVVGGPQYRVGSHRQFVLLARALAAAGFPTLRFDVRGMGDGEGELRTFEVLSADIAAAIDALLTSRPRLHRVVLWGLCDGASAALLYLQQRSDHRVVGVCLANPWLRSAVSQARANLRHYYRGRLKQRGFWLKLLRGDVAIEAARSLWGNLRAARTGSGVAAPASFQSRMAQGWQGFAGSVLLLLSGNDYTAREFDEYTAADTAWRDLLCSRILTRVDLPGADHTCSESSARRLAERATVDWLNRIG